MKKRLISFCMMLTMVLSLMLGAVVNVRADDHKTKNLDVVVVVDQSGSMKSNDPKGLMREAVNSLITMLSPETSRVGIISFNRAQTKVAELTELKDLDITKALNAKVDAIEYKGDTDIGNAVADAVEMFDENDDHAHAILVLSDGRNDFGIDKNAEKESDERLNDALMKAHTQGCQVFCLGFGKEMSNVNDTPYAKLLSIASAPENVSTETDPSKIHEFFEAMLARLIGSKEQKISGDEVRIEPNVKEANISISSPEDLSEIEVILTGPDGNEIPLVDSESVRYYKGKYSAVIKLFRPEPGVYKVTTSAEWVKALLGYLASYEYVLNTQLVDASGRETDKIANGKTGEIRAAIYQDEKQVTDPEVYNNLNATATVTAKDNGKEETIYLKYDGGELIGEISPDHIAAYDVEVVLDAESFHLEDNLSFSSGPRAIEAKQGLDVEPLGKKVLNKTFKKSVDLLVPEAELMSIIDNPDQIDVNVDQVLSSEEDKVEAQITDDGVLLTGKKWGSSIVSVIYKDELGSTLKTSFTVKVEDKLLVALFAILPILLGALIALVVFLIMKKSRMIKGDFEISRVEIIDGDDISIISDRKSYRANVFLGRKKNMAYAMQQYAQNVFSEDASAPQNKELLTLLSNNQTDMSKSLEEIKFVGTYLGRKGCTVVIKKGAPVSMSNNNSYGKAIKMAWPANARFKFYAKDNNGIVLGIEGMYSYQAPRRAAKPAKNNKNTAVPKTPSFNDFDDFGDTPDFSGFDTGSSFGGSSNSSNTGGFSSGSFDDSWDDDTFN